MYTVYSMPITRNSSVKSTNTQLTKVHQIMTFSNHSSIAIPIWAMFKILCRPFKNWLIHIFQFMDCHNSQFMQEYNPRTHHQPSLITYTLIFDPHISLITIINHHLSPSSTIINHHLSLIPLSCVVTSLHIWWLTCHGELHTLAPCFGGTAAEVREGVQLPVLIDPETSARDLLQNKTMCKKQKGFHCIFWCILPIRFLMYFTH